jgi:HEPN domain-containing protein
MLSEDQQRQFNSYVYRSFRDTADQDYIAARSAHRMELYIPFLWLASQAIEKYLKAILIFNGQSVIAFKDHDVLKIYDALGTIKDINFDFPTEVQDFMKYLTFYGRDRYFEHAVHLDGYELMRLDQAAWFIRRYCEMLRWRENTGDTTVRSLAEKLKVLQDSQTIRNPGKFRISGGFLEKVLKDKTSAARPALLFANRFYGGKKVIRRISSHSAWPQNCITPEILPELEKYIHFTKRTKEELRKRLVASSKP